MYFIPSTNAMEIIIMTKTLITLSAKALDAC
jgi:hypothetical protein